MPLRRNIDSARFVVKNDMGKIVRQTIALSCQDMGGIENYQIGITYS